ncbi:MAG: FmdE family protein [Thermodesulfobacteriota bacterium]
MTVGLKSFEEVVAFHGHSCPGLAMGYRAAVVAMAALDVARPEDEDLVAVVENSSCAVDGIQMVAGCTLGKGNLIFLDHGKQVYTFHDRTGGKGVRLAVHWPGVGESESEQQAWQRYIDGDRSAAVAKTVADLKRKKIDAILTAEAAALFSLAEPALPVPPPARIHPSLTCADCGEKVMASRAATVDGRILCIPCQGKERG